MRTINELTEETKTKCLAEHRCDPRAHHAWQYAVDWLRVHPPRESDDWYMVASHCLRAVECRGRNESACGQDWFSWDAITRAVVFKLIDWLFCIERGKA